MMYANLMSTEEEMNITKKNTHTYAHRKLSVSHGNNHGKSIFSSATTAV